MLTEICAWLKNYFCQEEDKIIGNFSIVNGAVTPPVDLQAGQYYRIVGSVFNDGVHSFYDELKDENEFHGAVWKMRVPQKVLDLAEEIASWEDKYGGVDGTNLSPYMSESFGGYSYSKGYRGGSDSGSGNGGTSWQDAFRTRLMPYMRIRA